jgi:hypothetical protein
MVADNTTFPPEKAILVLFVDLVSGVFLVHGVPVKLNSISPIQNHTTHLG